MNWKENMSRSKEVLGAYFRQGLHELGAALLGHGTAAQHPEYGMIGTKPPQLVTEGLRGDKSPAPERDPTVANALESYLQKSREQAPPGREPERSDPAMERE